jgi:hypothetical protein
MDTADESLAAQSIAGTNEEMKKIIWFLKHFFQNLLAEWKVVDIRRRREKNSSDCPSAMTRIGLKKDRYSNVYRDEHCIPTHTLWSAINVGARLNANANAKAAFATAV